jgi:cation diffusion facilitator family transporter
VSRAEIDDLYARGRRAAAWGLAAGLLLGASKLAGGWAGHSVALLADAVHSLGDALLSVAVWGALHWAQRPPDREHPDGHTRAEAVAGSSIALLLLLSAFGAGWQALRALAEPARETPHAWTLGIAATSFAVNEALFRYNRRVARRTGSRALEATAWDQRMDALTGLGVFAALLLALYGGPAFRLADPVAALGVAGVILVAGGRVFWSSVHELMDAQAGPDVVEAVRREALAVPGVLGVEKLLVRKAGLEHLVDIHVEVSPELSVRDGHAIGHAVKDRLREALVTVKDVLVHIEPAPPKSPAARGAPPPAPGPGLLH